MHCEMPCSHAGDYEDYCFLECDAMQSGRSNSVTEDTTFLTCIREDGVWNLGSEKNYPARIFAVYLSPSDTCLEVACFHHFEWPRIWKWPVPTLPIVNLTLNSMHMVSVTGGGKKE